MGLVEGRPLVEIGSEERVPSKRLVQVGVCLIEVVSQLVLQNWASNRSAGGRPTAGHILHAIAGTNELIECLAAPTRVKPGSSLDTVEVLLAVAGVLVESDGLEIIRIVAGQGTGEPEVPFSVTVGHLVRPVTLQCCLIERQTLRAIRYKAGPIGTVEIIATLVLVA